MYQTQTIIISDLHLSLQRASLIEAFAKFTQSLSENTTLIIAGDFFDFFVGVNPKDALMLRLQKILIDLHNRGLKVKFQCGNRDYLVNSKYCEFFAMSLLPDEYLLDTPQGKALLIHGDLLCLHDEKFKRFRNLCRNHTATTLFCTLPYILRNLIGAKIRAQSAKADSSRYISAEDGAKFQDLAVKLAQKHQVHILIHGHFHIFGSHSYQDSFLSQRLSLGAWGNNYSFVRITKDSLELVERPIKDLLTN